MNFHPLSINRFHLTMFNRRHFLQVSTLSVVSCQVSSQISSGEMHPARIPKAYWKHRIQMAKAMGRINYSRVAVDKKGIYSKVILQSTHPEHLQSEELQDWLCYRLPRDQPFLQQLRPSKSIAKRPGNFFKLRLDFTTIGDTYIDMQHWTKGVV